MNIKLYLLTCLLFSLSALSEAKNEPVDEDMQFSAELIKSLVLFFVDDELDSEVSAFIDYDFKHDIPDNAFIYFWGIDLDSEDPYADGLKILKQVNLANDNYKYEWETYDDSFMQEYDYIKTFNADFFCTFAEPDCLERIRKKTSERNEILLNNQLTYQRYNQFFSYANFHPLHEVNFHSPLPNLRMLNYGNQLVLIDMMQHLEKGDLETFYSSMTEDINRIKTKLSQAETLLSKMVLLSLLDWHIELISQLIQTQQIDRTDTRLEVALKALTVEELSTIKAMEYDLGNWLKLQQTLFENPHYMNKPSEKRIGSAIVNIILPMLSKSNLSLNIMYHQSVKPLMSFIALNPIEFYERYENFEAKAKYPPLRGFLSNYLASTFTDTIDSYLEYPARLYAMDMGIQLLRALREQGSWGKVIDKVEQGHKRYLNYYNQSSPYIDGNQMCYSGLFERTSRYRCLTIVK